MKVHAYRGASLRLLPFNWRDWLRASGHTAIILGFVLIALFWSAVEFDLWRERTRAEDAAQRTTSNLARVFESQILGAIRTGDRMMRALQRAATRQTLLVDSSTGPATSTNSAAWWCSSAWPTPPAT